MGLFSRKKKVEETPVAAAPVAAQQPAGIPGEVIAALSAAVAMMMGEGARIRSVRRVGNAAGTRSAWSMAGLLDNTRAF